MLFDSLVDEGALNGVLLIEHAPVAQRIRASDYGSEGREFESLQARSFPRFLSLNAFVSIGSKTYKVH